MNSIARKPLRARALAIALCAMLAFVCVPTDASAATSKNAKAHAAFERYATKHLESSYPYFESEDWLFYTSIGFYDIDKNGIDEMIYRRPGEEGLASYVIYSYYKGKVKKLCTVDGYSKYFAVYPKTHVVFVGWANGSGGDFYKVSSKKAVCLAKVSVVWSPASETYKDVYKVKNQKVTKAKYKKYIKSLKKGKKVKESKIKWRYLDEDAPQP